MEVRVNRIEFIKKLKVVEKAIFENKIKPIISCALIETDIDKNRLKFYGTNLEITIITDMECQVKAEGKIVFQPQIVEEYLKELSDETVLLKVDDFTLYIEGADSVSEFSLMDAEEFPINYLHLEAKEKSLGFNANSSALITCFEKTKFAASQSSDDMRINCIRMVSDGKSLKFVATDNFRMIYLEENIKTDLDFKISIPLNTIDAGIKLFKTLSEESVHVSIGTKNIKFTIGDTLVISRIIDLPFPDYEGTLKNLKYSNKLFIKAQDLLAMLKRVIIFVRNNQESKYGAIFTLSENKIAIEGINDFAKINEELSLNYSDEPVKISLNTKFLIDFIQNLNTDNELLIESTTSSGAVKITENNCPNYLYIVMPLTFRG
ncbi:MAG: DNA polymerase III subunit beta [Fusobacteriaceae bacterium]